MICRYKIVPRYWSDELKERFVGMIDAHSDVGYEAVVGELSDADLVQLAMDGYRFVIEHPSKIDGKCWVSDAAELEIQNDYD